MFNKYWSIDNFINQTFFFRFSSSSRNSLIEKSNKSLSFLEEQKLMKVNKSKDELIQIFETNISKEYGHFVKK